MTDTTRPARVAASTPERCDWLNSDKMRGFHYNPARGALPQCDKLAEWTGVLQPRQSGRVVGLPVLVAFCSSHKEQAEADEAVTNIEEL
jgi:hypothetical protein